VIIVLHKSSEERGSRKTLRDQRLKNVAGKMKMPARGVDRHEPSGRRNTGATAEIRSIGGPPETKKTSAAVEGKRKKGLERHI